VLPASLDPALILQTTEAVTDEGLAERTEADLYPVLQTGSFMERLWDAR
jgi:hypothetical protein